MTKQPEQTVTVAEVVAWLTKKAGEYRATRGRQHAVVADAFTTLASKVHRGAVRPNNVLGADLTTLDPIQLRWGLDHVMWGDDDTTTIMLSGPAGEPYWLELDPDRAVVLRGALAGPGGEQAAPADRDELRDRIAKALEREDAINAGYDHGFASSYGADAETDGFVDAVLAVLPAPADRAAALSDAERTMLAYALDQAQERIWSEDGFTDEDQAAVTSLRRLADEAQPTKAPAGDEDCERCDGSGLDPDAYFTQGDTWTHAPCSQCQPESDEAALRRMADEEPTAAPAAPADRTEKEHLRIERGELWSLLDWTFWGSGMGDVFREPLADTMTAVITPEQREQAEQLMEAWHASGRQPLGRRRYEELRAELRGARELREEAEAEVREQDAEIKRLRADRATVLREAADRYEQMLAKATPEQDPRYWTAVRDVTLGLRRLADEAQQAGEGR